MSYRVFLLRCGNQAPETGEAQLGSHSLSRQGWEVFRENNVDSSTREMLEPHLQPSQTLHSLIPHPIVVIPKQEAVRQYQKLLGMWR